MSKDSPIQVYLKKCKDNTTADEGAEFYVDRLNYYHEAFAFIPNDADLKDIKIKGYGEVEFWCSYQSAKDMYDFYFNALIRFIEFNAINGNRCKECKYKFQKAGREEDKRTLEKTV